MTVTPWENYPAYAAPAASDTVLVRDVSATPPSAGQVKQSTVAQFGASLVGIALPVYKPNGTDDTSAINALLAAGDPVWLLPYTANPYIISSPLNGFVSGSQLLGSEYWAAADNDNYGEGTGHAGGSVIYMVTGFPTGEYAIDLYNSSSTQLYGAELAGFSINGEALPSHLTNTAGGIRIHGAWGAGYVRGVAVIGMNGNGITTEVDDGTGKVPDEWRFEFVKSTGSYGGAGWTSDNLPDSSIVHCQASNNALDGIKIGWSTNTRIDHFKAEQNSQCGYHFTGLAGAGDIMLVTGCSTHINSYDGFFWDNTASGSGGGTYQLAGCAAVNDGQAGGTTYAGYRSAGNLDRIMAAGCSAQQAYYGAAETSSSYGMCFTGSWLSGSHAATYDDASNTHALVNQEPVPF